MKLLSKTLTIVAILTIVLTGALLAISYTIMLNSYLSIENTSIEKDITKVTSTISREMKTLDAIATDWASWDDTYEFAVSRSSNYIKSNLVDSAFTNLKINAILIVDAKGIQLYGSGFDLAEQVRSPLPESLASIVSPDNKLFDLAVQGESSTGLIQLQEGIVLVSVRPILKSNEGGMSRGAFVMARFITEDVIEDIRNISGVLFDVIPLSDATKGSSEIPEDILTELSRGSQIVIRHMDNDLSRAYATFNDINDKPLLVLRSNSERLLYKQGTRTIEYYISYLVASCLAFGLLTWLLFKKLVITRLIRLNRDIMQVKSSSMHSKRLSVDTDDEIGSVSTEINNMLGSLEYTYNELRESERKYQLLSSHIEEIRELERKAISQRVHEEIGQVLCALNLDLNLLEKRLYPDQAEVKRKIAQMRELTRNSIHSAQNLSSELRSRVIDTLGLSAMIETELQSFVDRTGCSINKSIDIDEKTIKPELAIVVYRIFQEALMNIARHADATKVSIDIKNRNGNLTLMVADDGNGISVADIDNPNSFGIIGIKERAKSLNGNVSIDGLPGEGTTLYIEVPCGN